jgi:ribosomal protein L29
LWVKEDDSLKAKLKTMQLTNTAELKATKKDIARIQFI